MPQKQIEAAKSRRSICGTCNKNIKIDTLRVRYGASFHHLPCLVPEVRIRNLAEKASQLRGWDLLNKDQKRYAKSILYPKIPSDNHINNMWIPDLKEELLKRNLSTKFKRKAELTFRLKQYLHNLLVIGYCSKLEANINCGTMAVYIKYIVLKYYTPCHDDKYKPREGQEIKNEIDPYLWRKVRKKIQDIVETSNLNTLTNREIKNKLKIQFPGLQINNQGFKKQIKDEITKCVQQKHDRKSSLRGKKGKKEKKESQ